MNTRFFPLVLALALLVPSLSQAAGRMWTVRYAPSFSVAAPTFQRQQKAPVSMASLQYQQARKPNWSIRSAPLNIRGKKFSLKGAVASSLQNSLKSQMNGLSAQASLNRSKRRTLRSLRRSQVRTGGTGVNSSGYQFPLN